MRHNSFRIAVQAALCAVSMSAAGIAAAQDSTPTTAPTSLPMATTTPVASTSNSESGLSIDDATPIEVGQDAEGSLSLRNSSDAYTFEAEVGQSFTALLVSADFDCYLILYDEDGNQVAYNDDGAGNLDSRLTYTVPRNGSYTLLATSYSGRNGTGNVSGDYTLSLNVIQIDLIEYSQTVDGELTTSAPQALYSFSGQAGDAIVIRHVSEDFDSYLRLIDSSGYDLASNDDGAGNLDAQIGPYTLPSTGSYQIVATSLNGSSVGNFTLSLDRIDVTLIAYGDTLEAPLDNGAAYFAFDGSSDDVVSLTVDSDVDTMLTLNDPSNYSLVSDDDSGRGRNPEVLDLLLIQDGSYLVVVRANDPDAEGTVSLTLERGVLPTLDEGPVTLSFSSTDTSRVVTFTPEVGQTYTLTMRLVSGGTFSPGIDITQDGSSLGYLSGSQSTRITTDITAYSDSPMRLTLSDYSYFGTSVEVSIVPSDISAGGGQG